MAFLLKLNKGRGIATGATLKFVRFASSDGAAGVVEEDIDGSQVEEAQEMIKFEIPPEGYIGLNADAGHSLNEKLSYMGGILAIVFGNSVSTASTTTVVRNPPTTIFGFHFL